jgi:hypothetical protein
VNGTALPMVVWYEEGENAAYEYVTDGIRKQSAGTYQPYLSVEEGAIKIISGALSKKYKRKLLPLAIGGDMPIELLPWKPKTWIVARLYDRFAVLTMPPWHKNPEEEVVGYLLRPRQA